MTTLIKPGEEFNLPGVAEVSKQMMDARLDKETKSLNENWKFSETHPDGFTLHYAMDNGQVTAWGTQDNLADYIELCMLKREAEAANPKAYQTMMVQKWILPPILKFELEARGFPVDDLLRTGNTYELDVIIEREWPQFKTTNLMLTKGKFHKK